jgi:hypothetical protein
MIRFPQGPAPGGAGGGRLPGFDDKLVSMYARGMTVREIQGHLADLYGIEMSPDLISAVTDAVLDEISEWQNRPLEPLYPLVFFDAIGQGPIPRRYRVWGQPGEGASREDVNGVWVRTTA